MHTRNWKIYQIMFRRACRSTIMASPCRSSSHTKRRGGLEQPQETVFGPYIYDSDDFCHVQALSVGKSASLVSSVRTGRETTLNRHVVLVLFLHPDEYGIDQLVGLDLSLNNSRLRDSFTSHTPRKRSPLSGVTRRPADAHNDDVNLLAKQRGRCAAPCRACCAL